MISFLEWKSEPQLEKVLWLFSICNQIWKVLWFVARSRRLPSFSKSAFWSNKQKVGGWKKIVSVVRRSLRIGDDVDDDADDDGEKEEEPAKHQIVFSGFVIDLFWLFFHVEPYSENFLSFSSTSYLLVSQVKYFFPSRDKSCEPIFAPFSASESSAAAATTTAMTMTMTTLLPPLVDVGGGGEKPSGGGERVPPAAQGCSWRRAPRLLRPPSLSLPPSFPLRRVIFFFPRVWSGLNNGKVRRRKSLHWGRPPEPKRACVCVRCLARCGEERERARPNIFPSVCTQTIYVSVCLDLRTHRLLCVQEKKTKQCLSLAAEQCKRGSERRGSKVYRVIPT